jgi:hypothetical protein
MVYSRNGQGQPVGDLHEGNSDVLANFLDRNPDIGIGFYQDECGPGSGIRNADNDLQWPSNPGGHAGGQIIAGFHWDAWQTMLALESQAVADSVAAHTWHYARDMGTPTTQQDQVTWTFLIDDDDADLTNGTPNYDHFAQAGLDHGFTIPVKTEGLFITHEPLSHSTDDTGGYDVVATIISTEASLDPAALKVVYQVDGGAVQELALTATGNPDEFGATIPAQDQHSEIAYHLEAADLGGLSRLDPVFFPLSVHSFDVAAVYDDLEGDTSGWSTVDNATTGEWEVADPIATGACPDDDATADPGVLAWITGQCSGPNCSTCSLGCNDIDGGTVELFSPVWDVSAFDEVTLKYERFYNNNTGADPNNDTFIVEVSNDGGSTWTEIENTMASTANWTTVTVDVDAMFGTPGQVQLHFVASDLNAGSIVEAGVDDVRILASSAGAVAADLPAAAAPLALSLEQNQPNPFRPETTIRFALPEAGDARLAVYDVTGRAVRELANGPRAAGRHTVTWDGQDRDGNRVAAGVYFYRLTAGGEVLTRKMTVLK